MSVQAFLTRWYLRSRFKPRPGAVIRVAEARARWGGDGPMVLDVPVDPALLAAGDHNGSTFYQHRNFADVVARGTTPEVSLDDGWWAVVMGKAAQISASTGQAVTREVLHAMAPPFRGRGLAGAQTQRLKVLGVLVARVAGQPLGDFGGPVRGLGGIRRAFRQQLAQHLRHNAHADANQNE